MLWHSHVAALPAVALYHARVTTLCYDAQDHVVPPPAPNPDGKVSVSPPFNFTQLGVRVPAVRVFLRFVLTLIDLLTPLLLVPPLSLLPLLLMALLLLLSLLSLLPLLCVDCCVTVDEEGHGHQRADPHQSDAGRALRAQLRAEDTPRHVRAARAAADCA